MVLENITCVLLKFAAIYLVTDSADTHTETQLLHRSVSAQSHRQLIHVMVIDSQVKAK